MKTELYREEERLLLRHRLVGRYVACASLVAVAFTIAVGLCFLVDDTNATLLRALTVTLTSLGSCAALYIGLEDIRPRRARMRYLTRMLTAPRRSLTGVLRDTGRVVTVAPAVTARPLPREAEDGSDPTEPRIQKNDESK